MVAQCLDTVIYNLSIILFLSMIALGTWRNAVIKMLLKGGDKDGQKRQESKKRQRETKASLLR
mgnify:CR=1 FL=1